MLAVMFNFTNGRTYALPVQGKRSGRETLAKVRELQNYIKKCSDPETNDSELKEPKWFNAHWGEISDLLVESIQEDIGVSFRLKRVRRTLIGGTVHFV